MKIKKFYGVSTYDAMLKMKKELGSDAVILNTRTVREKGLIGFFKKPKVEITAVYEEKDAFKLNVSNNNLNKINQELENLKNMVEGISSSIVEKKTEIPKKLEIYQKKLIENGVNYYIATAILKTIEEQINLKDQDEERIEEIVKYTLLEYIGDAKPLCLNKGEQKVVFFIGPTGVGKTTTLAKMAAQLVINNQYNIGLITSDTYRIAAVDQLKTYSDILKLPLKVVYDEKDMFQALANFREKDIILVDTAGKNHKQIDEKDEIVNIMKSVKNKEIYLVVSGTTSYNTLKSIISHYDFIEDYSIIFTKIDEADNYGNVLNAKYLTKKPVSYITTGQNVPDDIEIFDRDKAVKCLIGENIL
ncbi:flagellar biosynthesis protein FlhF [Keratinibaculum paraultunense]|uniref:Flagellar biosynthesis protein FlhF n=1 Tax=Keratinibaculum paraultunense TaxID=1278232 RepID=A0A4R3KWZ9_9FIRM|nr:flagellar biosynthesis protein FlhF [Keratinibaculum paraultunense]QQY80719.1 flagellar biosynthesis protein FlhF [Keratinibaculum paraultunense]TCS89676.1 flagellar biosynthesis protein FlhF [Keratinibaculum paraultunense]